MFAVFMGIFELTLYLAPEVVPAWARHPFHEVPAESGGCGRWTIASRSTILYSDLGRATRGAAARVASHTDSGRNQIFPSLRCQKWQTIRRIELVATRGNKASISRRSCFRRSKTKQRAWIGPSRGWCSARGNSLALRSVRSPASTISMTTIHPKLE